MTFSNYHTHTVFCDGNDTPEELILEAIRLGCPEIGFSGHAFMTYDESYCMSREGTREYCRTIRALREKYRDRIRVWLGIEQDYYSEAPEERYDYIIGSVHAVEKDGDYLTVDWTREVQKEHVARYYGGDFYAYIEDYYRTVGDLYRKTGCDMIGHFDVITKFNEDGSLFDEAHPRYRRAALSALDRLCESPAAFEINTGAVAKGYRGVPYPSPFLIDELKKRSRRLVLTSDCHDKSKLLFGFEEFAPLLR